MADPSTSPIATPRVGRPVKGQEKINLVECWRLRVQKKLSYREIAAYFNCNESSVIRACQRLATLIPDPEAVDAYRSVKADLLDAAEMELMASLMQPEKMEKASLNNVAYAFQQIHNAGRLERGESTSNLSVMSRLMQDAQARLFENPTTYAEPSSPQAAPPTGCGSAPVENP